MASWTRWMRVADEQAEQGSLTTTATLQHEWENGNNEGRIQGMVAAAAQSPTADT